MDSTLLTTASVKICGEHPADPERGRVQRLRLQLFVFIRACHAGSSRRSFSEDGSLAKEGQLKLVRLPLSLAATPRSFAFYPENPFPRFVVS